MVDEIIPGIQRLRGLLREVANSGVEHNDPRLGWVSVQIDRNTWNAMNPWREEPPLADGKVDITEAKP